MAACLAKADLTWRERVMLAVVAYHDGDGGALPSQERLADMLDMRVSRVNEAIRGPGAKGRFQWEARHGSARAPNLYKITCGEPFESGGRGLENRKVARAFHFPRKRLPIFRKMRNRTEITAAPLRGRVTKRRIRRTCATRRATAG